jgi:type I restriction enzyme S subunit
MLNELLVSLESGSRPRGGGQGIQEGIPSIGGEHLTYEGGFNFRSIKFVPQDFATKMSKGHIKKNDVLIVKDGATTGKTAFVGEDFPYEEAVVNEHVFICRTTELISPRFLFRYLISEEGKNEILKNFQGSAQGGINSSFAANTVIPLAPINEQRRIVDKLEKLLARVKNCRERLDKIPGLLKRFRQSVLAAACSGRLTADWREKNPGVEPANKLSETIIEIKSNQDHTIDHMKFEIWQYIPVSQVTRVVLGGTPKRTVSSYWNGSIKWARAKDIANCTTCYIFNTEETITEDGVKNSVAKILPKGTVIITARGTVGEVRILGEDMAINQSCYGLLPRNGIESKFLYYALQGSMRNVYDLTYGTVFSTITIKTFDNIFIPLCSLEEQQEIVRRVDALFKIADQIETRYQKAKAYVDKLTQSILAKAFWGELVLQDPADEPAAILLERIREERARRVLESLQKGSSRRKSRPGGEKKANKA